MIIRSIGIILCCFCLSPAIGADDDTVMLRDLTYDWHFYHHNSESYLPLVSKSAFKGNAVHFDLHRDEFGRGLMLIQSNQEVSVFIENKMVDIINQEKYFDLDSLWNSYKRDQLHFTLYSPDLNVQTLSTKILQIEAGAVTSDEDIVLVRLRSDRAFQNFLLLAVLILAVFLAALHNYFPRVLSDFFKVSRALALRDSDENLLKGRPMSQVNLLFYLFLSMLIALVLIFLANYAGIYPEGEIFYLDTFWGGMWKWLKISLLVLVWLIAKYVLVTNMSTLFRLGGFVVSHYFNYIRLALLIFTGSLILILFSYFGFNILEVGYYSSLLNIILVFLGIRMVILFFKLLSTASYKTLHLFSYLCGTEVIPFVILLYLGLNQPF